MLRGSTEILNTVCQELGGISPGQTTKDGKFTVIEVECQGACSNAPMMVIGDDFYVCFIMMLSLPEANFLGRRT
jgi:NADH dehydrogenase (ubiquinone) flavoprotein 2